MFENVSVWNSMSKSVTHVVACGGRGHRCNRTFKYIAGIAQGCWIVSPDWVTSCLENEKMMDEEHFEIVGDLDMVNISFEINCDLYDFRIRRQMCHESLGFTSREQQKRKAS